MKSHTMLPPADRCHLKNCVSKLLTVAIVLLLVEREASAYTDPGTGAMLWQAIVAGFFGVAFYFRKALFRLKSRKNTAPISSDHDCKTPR